jgi:hypothetical protein
VFLPFNTARRHLKQAIQLQILVSFQVYFHMKFALRARDVSAYLPRDLICQLLNIIFDFEQISTITDSRVVCQLSCQG